MLGINKKGRPFSETIISPKTEINGDVHVIGHLQVDGVIRGNVSSPLDSGSTMTISEQGRVEGQIQVPHVLINGEVTGDVYATVKVELHVNARVTGNVYYAVLEMMAGAEVNGQLVHSAELPKDLIKESEEMTRDLLGDGPRPVAS